MGGKETARLLTQEDVVASSIPSLLATVSQRDMIDALQRNQHPHARCLTRGTCGVWAFAGPNWIRKSWQFLRDRQAGQVRAREACGQESLAPEMARREGQVKSAYTLPARSQHCSPGSLCPTQKAGAQESLRALLQGGLP